uniref:Uncharacterized protein n=1 Tax=Globodera rostochiensis TaxID=31243 RepID=A0A914HL20_GLORO
MGTTKTLSRRSAAAASSAVISGMMMILKEERRKKWGLEVMKRKKGDRKGEGRGEEAGRTDNNAMNMKWPDERREEAKSKVGRNCCWCAIV